MREEEGMGVAPGPGMGAIGPRGPGSAAMPMNAGAGPTAGMSQTPAPSKMPEEDEGEEGEDSNVSPEEQALYHKFMENYYTVMYIGGAGNEKQPPLADSIIGEHFSGNLQPVDALANAGMSVVDSLSRSAADAGKPIPGDVLMHAGVEVLEDLAELAENAGFHEYNEEELDGALYRAMDLYREVNQQSLNKEEIQSDYEMMVQADKEGRLDEVLPGASKAAEKMPQPEEELPEEAPVAPTGGMGRPVNG
jgi:hypothetical protein